MKLYPKQNCLQCQREFQSCDKDANFCSRSCSAIYHNKRRGPPSEEHKRKSGEGLRKFWENKRLTDPDYIENNRKKVVAQALRSQIGKHKVPKSLLEISKRTTAKILKRLGIGCSRCGWKEAACDIHHILGRRVADADCHKNLTCLCPNCHRLAHNHKIDILSLVSLEKQIGDNWKKYYYG